MNLEQYIEIRRAIPVEKVSCGYRAVTLFSEAELEDAQIGYSIGEGGEDVTGESDGDWRANWLVIGDEDVCGDPIFVDLTERQISPSSQPLTVRADGSRANDLLH